MPVDLRANSRPATALFTTIDMPHHQESPNLNIIFSTQCKGRDSQGDLPKKQTELLTTVTAPSL